jgi:quinol monooxygenase YgiN
MSPLVREVTFRARRGAGRQLSERLLVAAAMVADEPGCEMWLVQRDASDSDVIRVIEQWGSSEQCEAALARELGRYGMSDVPDARYTREQLNAVQSGLTHYRMAAGQRGGWGSSPPPR